MASTGGWRDWARALVGLVDTPAISTARQDACRDQCGHDTADRPHLLAMAHLRLAPLRLP